jgi:hypothetical protein
MQAGGEPRHHGGVDIRIRGVGGKDLAPRVFVPAVSVKDFRGCGVSGAEIGIEAERGVEVLKRLSKLAEHTQDEAEIVVRFDIPGIVAESVFEGLPGLIGLSGPGEGNGQPHVGSGKGGIGFNG